MPSRGGDRRDEVRAVAAHLAGYPVLTGALSLFMLGFAAWYRTTRRTRSTPLERLAVRVN